MERMGSSQLPDDGPGTIVKRKRGRPVVKMPHATPEEVSRTSIPRDHRFQYVRLNFPASEVGCMLLDFFSVSWQSNSADNETASSSTNTSRTTGVSEKRKKYDCHATETRGQAEIPSFRYELFIRPVQRPRRNVTVIRFSTRAGEGVGRDGVADYKLI